MLRTADFITEAKRVAAKNPWLNYALWLHRSREMGIYNTVLDALTERPLDRDELRQLLVFLFGTEAMQSAPNVHKEWKEFCDFLANLNQTEAKHWKVKTGKMESWIDLRLLKKAYGGGTAGGITNHGDVIKRFFRRGGGGAKKTVTPPKQHSAAFGGGHLKAADRAEAPE